MERSSPLVCVRDREDRSRASWTKPLTDSVIGLLCLPVDFEWDDAKDIGNQRKHGLSFAEARALFESGADYLEIFDANHSESEDRFIAIGPIGGRVIIVVYTEPEEDLVRIIGARPATKREQSLYRSYMDQYRCPTSPN